MESEVERVTIIFSGNVQGVGFRYTAANISRLYLQTTGYAENLSDGTVKLVLEGQKDDILRFVNDIYHYFSSYIVDRSEKWEMVPRQFKFFTIKG